MPARTMAPQASIEHAAAMRAAQNFGTVEVRADHPTLWGILMRTKTFSRVALVVTMTSAAALHAIPALAAPVKAPGVYETTTTCAGREVVMVVPPNDSPFTPAFVVGTKEVFVPYYVIYDFTDEDGNQTYTKIAKGQPVPDDAVTCSASGEFEDGGTVTSFTITGVGRFVGKP